MKSRIIGRKQLLTFSLVLALSLAMFVNWYYTNPKNVEKEPEVTNQANLGDAQYVNSNSVKEDFFQNAELNRNKAHDSAKEYLSSIIADEKIDEETKASAREKLINISEQIKVENDIENLVSAQTKGKCIVTYDLESIEVILPKDTVNEEVALKIKSIILSKTKLTSDKITIIESK